MAAVWSDIKNALGGAVAEGARRVAQRFDKGSAVQVGSIPGLRPIRPPEEEDRKPAKVPDPKALFSDPYSVMQAFGYKDRQSSVSYDTLRDIIYRLPIVSNIIQVRVEQVASFGHVAADRYQMGFRIKMREKHDTPSGAEAALCRKFEKFLLHTGLTGKAGHRDSFEVYLRKITRDALIFDQNCTEIVQGNNDKPAEFYAIDAANVRIAKNLKGFSADEDEDTAYVEVWNEAIRTRWRAQDLIFGVRNPSTDIRLNGYGTSELEYLMSALTSLLNATNFNALSFTQGTLARGLLNLRDPDISNRDLNTVEQRFHSMLNGVENAGRIPVIASKDGVEWINLQGPSDQSFREWMDYLIKLITASYKISPEELNLSYGPIGQTSSLTQPNNEFKISDSKERGLRPLLRHIASNINHHLIWPHTDELEFEFAGLDSMTREQQVDFDTRRVNSTLTLNEVRAENDLPPLPGGDVVLNGTYIQNKSQEAQAQQQAEQQAQMQAAPMDEMGQPVDDGQGDAVDPTQVPVDETNDAQPEPMGVRELLGVAKGHSIRKSLPRQPASRQRLDVTL